MDELNLQACASEELNLGDLLVLDIDDQGERTIRKARSNPLDKYVVGFAARNLKRDEIIEYNLSHDTKDVFRKLATNDGLTAGSKL